ncbi:MAG: hypothetical protein U1F09_13150 [Steroidobacteraceae bacterium]
MTITYGTPTATTLTSSWDGAKFVATQSHTLASGSTQIVVVIHGLTIGSLTVKWGSTSLTLQADISDGNQGRVRFYDLDAPASGTANVVVESAIHDMTGAGVTIIGISGVDTGTPRRTAGTATAYGATASVAVTTVSGDSVLAFASTTNAATIDGSMTSLNDNLLAASERGSLGYITASGTSTTAQWTQTAEQWAIAAIPYVPASGGGSAALEGAATAGASATGALTIKKAKLRLDIAAAGEVVDGIVWANQGGAIAGAEIGEFTGQTIATGSGADAGFAVLKVPVSLFGGGALNVGDTVQMLVRNSTKSSDLWPATIIEE